MLPEERRNGKSVRQSLKTCESIAYSNYYSSLLIVREKFHKNILKINPILGPINEKSLYLFEIFVPSVCDDFFKSGNCR